MIKQELTLGDVLKKGEIKDRIWIKPNAEDIKNPEGVICGKTFIAGTGELGGMFLLALSNLENGKVLVQSHDCELSLQGFTRAMINEQLNIMLAPIAEDGSDPMEQQFNRECGRNGITYIDFPKI